MKQPALRVAALTTFHEPCGIATYSEALTDALEAQGVRVTVLAPWLRPGTEPRGAQPPRLWQPLAATLHQAVEVFWTSIYGLADVLHLQVQPEFYSPEFLSTLSQLCRSARVPVFATVHGRSGGSRARIASFEATLSALGSAELIVHNDAHAAELARDRVHVVGHGINPAPISNPIRARRELGMPSDARLLSHFGFLHPDKGIDEVLLAVNALVKNGQHKLRYQILGGTFPMDESQRYLERLRATARELQLVDHVNVTGEFLPEEQALTLLRASDWVILNYKTGSFQATSGAARHALAAGRPLAVSEASVFDDLRAAVHTLKGPLEGELSRLLTEPELSRHVSERARWYCDAHSWPKTAERHVELYERALRRA